MITARSLTGVSWIIAEPDGDHFCILDCFCDSVNPCASWTLSAASCRVPNRGPMPV